MRFFFKHRGSYFRFIKGDHVCLNLRRQAFENRELDFVLSFLQPGDTFWDVGANFGLFSVLAAKKVGRLGKVVAFEPSPINHGRLKLNLWINGLFRVKTERMALGKEIKEDASFYESTQGAYSGLKVGDIPGRTQRITVQETTLDAYVQNFTPVVQLLKIDVEGGEWDVFLGGRSFFGEKVRPVILAELDDDRTRPAGYAAREIYHELANLGYRWYSLEPNLKLKAQEIQETYHYLNLVACPEEKVTALARYLEP